MRDTDEQPEFSAGHRGRTGGCAGFVDEFEACPDWVPAVDTGRRSRGKGRFHRFNHSAIRPVKVRNVSSVGAPKNSVIPFELAQLNRTPP